MFKRGRAEVGKERGDSIMAASERGMDALTKTRESVPSNLINLLKALLKTDVHTSSKLSNHTQNHKTQNLCLKMTYNN